MGLMDIFADPSTFDTLSVGEKVIGSLITALMGMGTTFVVLILIWGFIALIGKIVRKEETAFKKDLPSEPVATPVASAGANPDEALVAVIMAAILAAEGPAFTNNLVVRKIRRIPGPDPVWSSTGRNECLDSRRG